MNHKLRELIDQTEKDISGKWISLNNVEKLAERIVKECIQIVENNPSWPYNGYADMLKARMGDE
jgi:hypothetical protein